MPLSTTCICTQAELVGNMAVEANVSFRPIADIRAWPKVGRMRTSVPPPFELTFHGPEGPYIVRFQPTGEWDGIIDVSIAGQDMRWNVDDADRDEGGGVVLGGMTGGSERLWADQFWFELRLADTPPVIRYWGDKVVWREDRAASA